MRKKFNPKVFQGKQRVYAAVPQAPRVSRLWIWDADAKEYRSPSQGKPYYAARYQTAALGRKKRVYESFESLEEARNWQSEFPEETEERFPGNAGPSPSGPLFGEVLDEWRRRRLAQLAPATRVQYEKIIRLHFGGLLELRITDITPRQVDLWLDLLKEANTLSKKRLVRRSFDHELSLLSTVLRYYLNYHDDQGFQFPIKQRHREAMYVTRTRVNSPKDLSEEEFERFRDALLGYRDGKLLAVMATVQYFQALRISEAAGLCWQDVQLEWDTPRNSRVKVVRSVCYPHKTGIAAFLKEGFKNAAANQGMKEQPMFPETFHALLGLYRADAKGLIFSLEGKPIEYRTIQSRYNRAFRLAGLPYRGTHVMRHGGCRRVFNEVGELPIAQQLLGNADMKTTLIYAKRSASALTKVAHGHWERRGNVRLLASACIGESRE